MIFDRSLIGEVINDEYVIEDLIGAGGMGTAYRAVHRHLQRKVCIKFLETSSITEPKFIRRFKREARVLGTLSHPNIVTCFAYGVYKHIYPYLVMELLEGHSLREELSAGPLDPIRACRILSEVCNGLQYAHRAGFSHRDVKPDNIMVCKGEPETAKLVDFGLVGKNSKDIGLETITVAGQVMGTPMYMAPEAFAGIGQGRSVDIYAAGCSLYECLAGKAPFEAKDFSSLMHMHAYEDIPPLSKGIAPDSASRMLDSIIRRATNKNPDKRFMESVDMQRQLQAVSGVLTGRDQFTSEFELESVVDKRPPYRLTIPVILVCVLCLGGFAAFWSATFKGKHLKFHAVPQSKQTIDPVRLKSLLKSVRSVGLQTGSKHKEQLSGQLAKLTSELMSFLLEFGSEPNFLTNTASTELLSGITKVIPLLSQVDDTAIADNFNTVYVDLLTCCGFYDCALQSISAQRSTACMESKPGSTTDAARFFDEVLDASYSKDTKWNSSLQAHLRPLAPRLALVGDYERLLKLAKVFENKSQDDQWKPSLPELAMTTSNSSKEDPAGTGSKGYHVSLLQYLAKEAHKRGDISTSAMLYKQLEVQQLSGQVRVQAANNMLESGQREPAVQLLNKSLQDASRNGNSPEWLLRIAKLAQLRAAGNELKEARAILDETFQDPRWQENMEMARSNKDDRGFAPSDGLADLMEAIHLVGNSLHKSGDNAALTSILNQVGAMVLVAGKPGHYVQYGSYTQWWQIDTPTVRQVTQRATEVLEPDILVHGFFCARPNFQYALLLLNENRVKEAKTYFLQGVEVTDKCISLSKSGTLAPGSQPLLRSLRTFRSTRFSKDALAILAKISTELNLKLERGKGHSTEQTETGKANGEDPISRR